MKTSGNTILITGGGTGIGLALADMFVQQYNQVLICGRRQEKLEEAQKRIPELHTFRCDLSRAEDRQSLYDWAIQSFPNLNVLVNNAGIQKMIDLKQGPAAIHSEEDEIEINLTAPIDLCSLFIPHLLKQPESALINVTGGLEFIPIASMPIYCATKAALHSYTLSLRHQLRDTRIKVFELIPPTVDTELDHGSRERRGMVNRGIKPEEVARETLPALAKDEMEIAIGQAQYLRQSARENPEAAFERLNSH